jgi:uncharacterized protein (DUF1778 family)
MSQAFHLKGYLTMTSAPIPTPEPEKWIGGTCDADTIRDIDVAAAIVGQSRAKFLIDAAREKARTVLGSRDAQSIIRPE